MSAWVRREYFPGDVVITCALDTGVSLSWLATGLDDNSKKNQNTPDSKEFSLPKRRLSGGVLDELGFVNLDVGLFGLKLITPFYLEKGTSSYLIEEDVKTIGNGDWLLDIDGNKDIYTASRLPGNRIKVSSDISSFECSASDVTPIGIVALTIKKSI